MLLCDHSMLELLIPRTQAFEMLEDITSIIACQEKSYAFPMPFAVIVLNGMIPMLS